MTTKKGLVYLFTGTGKGKTSAALGVAARMLSIGKRVSWISWYKSSEWPISEKNMIEHFPDSLSMYWSGKGFYIKSGEGESRKFRKTNGARVMDNNTPAGHKKAAEEGLLEAMRIIEENEVEGGIRTDLLVLDELVQAINDGLLSLDSVLKMIASRGQIHLILTGRNAAFELISVADLVSEINNIKHPYDKGGLAVRGLDY